MFKYKSFDDNGNGGNERRESHNVQPPAFRRLSREAQPLPGTIVVACGVCGARYQKRLDCGFFQCEGCGALVTHNSSGYSPGVAVGGTVDVSVVVQQQSSEHRRHKKKKKKKSRSPSSASTSSTSSSSSESEHKKKKASKRRIRALEKQVKTLQKNRGESSQHAAYNASGSCSQPWPVITPVSPLGQGGVPQLMDSWPPSAPSSPSDAAFKSWPTAGMHEQQWPSPSHDEYGRRNSRNPFSAAGPQWPDDAKGSVNDNSSWGQCSSPGSLTSSAWPAVDSPTARGPHNPFQDPFGVRNVTVNVPQQIATLSSDQLMLLAQAKRCIEHSQSQQQEQEHCPLQLQGKKFANR